MFTLKNIVSKLILLLLGLFHGGIRIRRCLTISFNPRTFFRIQNIYIRLLLQYKERFFRIRHLHFGRGFVLPFTSRRLCEIEMKTSRILGALMEGTKKVQIIKFFQKYLLRDF